MQLFEIALPSATNEGCSNYGQERLEWESIALKHAGGYTYLGQRWGAWQEPQRCVIHKETMHGYRVACDAQIMDRLIDEAFRLFPDQKAILCATIGYGNIHTREEREVA